MKASTISNGTHVKYCTLYNPSNVFSLPLRNHNVLNFSPHRWTLVMLIKIA